MKKNSHTTLIAAICLFIGMAVSYFMLGGRVNTIPSDNKVQQVLELINRDYVDKVNTDSLTDNAINSILKELDPHSVYLNAKQTKRENESLSGKFYGIGVNIRMTHDTVTIVKVIKGSPAQKSGVLAGDRVLKVNGRDMTKDATIDTAMAYMRGEKGSKAILEVKRNGEKKPLKITILRDKITTEAVRYFTMLDKTTGYIKLEEFSATSAFEVEHAIKSLKTKGMKSLVFDLRGNGGGYLDQAVDIADQFISKGKLIVYTKGRHYGRQDYFATEKGCFETGDLIVMIDEFSASASEIVSGCIQDNDRGIVVGRRTFGKGLVQEQRSMRDDSSVRLTIARYYTPSGRCIQRPYTSGDPEKYYQDFLDRYQNMETDSDTIDHKTCEKFKTAKGRTVYGGGGIEPDINIPYSVIKRGDYLKELLKENILIRYSIDYVDKHRKDLKQYPDGHMFIKNFTITEAMFNDLVAYAQTNGVKKKAITSQQKEEIKLLLKAYIAEETFDDKAYNEIFLQLDQELHHALTSRTAT